MPPADPSPEKDDYRGTAIRGIPSLPAGQIGQFRMQRIQMKPKEKTHECLNGTEKTAGSSGSRDR